MNARRLLNNNGFTLVEIMLGALIIIVTSVGIASLLLAENMLLAQASHRLQAINYARACAERLQAVLEPDEVCSIVDWPSELTTGLHTEATDPSICALPASYFRDELNGKIEYNIEEMASVETPVSSMDQGLLRAEIIVEWTEKFPKTKTVKEKLYMTPGKYLVWTLP